MTNTTTDRHARRQAMADRTAILLRKVGVKVLGVKVLGDWVHVECADQASAELAARTFPASDYAATARWSPVASAWMCAARVL